MSTQMLAQNSMSDLFAQVSEEHKATEPDWLLAKRKEAFDHFVELGFPTTRMEDWRFTSVAPIADTTFTIAADAPVTESDVAPHLYSEYDGPRLVFVDGVFAENVSSLAGLPEGVTLCRLNEAASNATFREKLGTLSRENAEAFTALNMALARDGVFLHFPANVASETPVQLIYIKTGTEPARIGCTRNLFVFGTSSQARLVETHVSLADGPAFTNIVTEAFVGANAHVDVVKVQNEAKSTFHVASLFLRQDRDSVYRQHGFDFGGALVRNNVRGNLEGTACEAIVNGLYMLDGNQHVDNWMWMEHAEENIPSHELYKGILDGKASAVFTGRIFVHQKAQRTDAKQTNQNLLLSDDARVNTKPQLEIYADDVKCTHGATIGQLDQTALFYLMSRGIERGRARNLLVHAFAGDIIERVNFDPVRERIESLLNNLLPQ